MVLFKCKFQNLTYTHHVKVKHLLTPYEIITAMPAANIIPPITARGTTIFGLHFLGPTLVFLVFKFEGLLLC